MRNRRNTYLLIPLAMILLLACGYAVSQHQTVTPKAVTASSVHQPDVQPKVSPAPTPPVFSKTSLSTDDPASIWVVVNKHRPLQPKDYVPSDLVTPAIPLRSGTGSSEMQLRKAAASALETMNAAASKDGLHLMLASGYRSYNLQVSVYSSEVRNNGQAIADSESARPGFSEHQTGLAADLEPASRQCEVADCFGTTPEGLWLVKNASVYGFIKRYTPDKVAITGYRAEAWHYRYVGVPLAQEMQKKGVQTLEEFFALEAAPSYK